MVVKVSLQLRQALELEDWPEEHWHMSTVATDISLTAMLQAATRLQWKATCTTLQDLTLPTPPTDSTLTFQASSPQNQE